MSDDDNTRSIPQRPSTRAMPVQPSSNLPEPRPYPGNPVAQPKPPVQYAPPAQQGYQGQPYHPPQGNQGNQGNQGYGGQAGGNYGQPPVHYNAPPAYGPTYGPTYGPGYGSTTTLVRPAPNGALIAVAWIIAVFTFLYMLPWAVAATRGKSNQGVIGLLNFFLGWSFVGWVVALIMACASEPQQIVVVQQNNYGPGYHR